jgi:hypothetical protein
VKSLAFTFLFISVFLYGFASGTQAQKRDYLTDSEVELVREAQEIDRRIDVLTKAIDRRLEVLDLQAASDVKARKYGEEWGDAPTGSRPELMSDIRSLLQKAIDDIDDGAAHEGQTARPLTKTLLPKALRNLAGAAERYLPAFRAELDHTASDKDKGPMLASIDLCQQIIEAAAKLPKEDPKASKKKNSKDNNN